MVSITQRGFCVVAAESKNARGHFATCCDRRGNCERIWLISLIYFVNSGIGLNLVNFLLNISEPQAGFNRLINVVL